MTLETQRVMTGDEAGRLVEMTHKTQWLGSGDKAGTLETLHVESEGDVGDLGAGDERPNVGSGDDVGDYAAWSGEDTGVCSLGVVTNLETWRWGIGDDAWRLSGQGRR